MIRDWRLEISQKSPESQKSPKDAATDVSTKNGATHIESPKVSKVRKTLKLRVRPEKSVKSNKIGVIQKNKIGVIQKNKIGVIP